MAHASFAIFGAATFSLVIGCSSSSSSGAPTDAGSSTNGAAAAEAVAKALCDRTMACAPALVIGIYGDVAACTARLTTTSLLAFGANGANATPAAFEACAQALPSTTCGDFLSNRLPAACKAPAGTLADGAACAVDAQCAASHCKIPLGQTCGACAKRAAAGGACGVTPDCEDGFVCVGGKCSAPGAAGASCSATAPCRGDLVCRGGSCASAASAGSACAQGDGCDELHSVVCSVEAKKCIAVSYGSTNAACGVIPGGFEVCSASGYCKGLAAPNYQGTCVAAASDGAACDLEKGPFCNPGAVCVSGTCTLPDPSKCQ